MAKYTEKEQDDPRYIGADDESPTGKRAYAAYKKAQRADDFDMVDTAPASKAGRKAARESVAKERDQVRTMSRVDVMGNPYKKGGAVKSASSRADGIAQRGKTRGKMR